ncbi:MAG: TonB-dependent receptor, partial [Luteibaculum sp.]
MRLFLLLFSYLLCSNLFAQFQIKGKVLVQGEALPGANIYVPSLKTGTISGPDGFFVLQVPDQKTFTIRVSYVGYQSVSQEVNPQQAEGLKISLMENPQLSELVVTGTLREMTKLESPVPVELYRRSFIQKNPVPNLFESLERINGVRPQINCNVCNTGDIHINGLEGPYTMVLIDGMPIVSGLSTVYGLSGIPAGILDQMEIVKGPSSAIYGSEALGGVINVITKMPEAKFGGELDMYTSSWLESNLDLSLNTPLGDKTSLLTGINYFQYNNPKDNNGDNFTDIALQNRYSIFNKLAIKRPNAKRLSLASRIFYEDRWGGEMNWKPQFAGGDSIYGESIQTQRAELLGFYDIQSPLDLSLQFSYNIHQQNSFYGTTSYNATQQIGFGQLLWNTNFGKSQMVNGIALRYNHYDDNTPATSTAEDLTKNQPELRYIPGLFSQFQRPLGTKLDLLLGIRVDHHQNHGLIPTPRFALKYKVSDLSVIRLNGGTGFRVVQIFTEDHAALTGARKLVIADDIKPERSASINLNYEQQLYSIKGNRFGLDLSAWYTHFSNQIIPDYESNVNEIRYDNLDFYAISRGFSVNFNARLVNGFSGMLGASFLDVFQVEQGSGGELEKNRPLLSERYTGTFTLSYQKPNSPWSIDYTGNVYGPMFLPLLGELDTRPDQSPWWSIQNVQFTYQYKQGIEFYGGIKNLLNFTPPDNSIARAHDPFDKNVVFDEEGNPLATADNPQALSFDPSYVFAPNQGRRYFL